MLRSWRTGPKSGSRCFPSKVQGETNGRSGFGGRKQSSVRHNSCKFQGWDVLKLPRKSMGLFSPAYKRAQGNVARSLDQMSVIHVAQDAIPCDLCPGGLLFNLDIWGDLHLPRKHLTSGIHSDSIAGTCLSVISFSCAAATEKSQLADCLLDFI